MVSPSAREQWEPSAPGRTDPGWVYWVCPGLPLRDGEGGIALFSPVLSTLLAGSALTATHHPLTRKEGSCGTGRSPTLDLMEVPE